MAVELTNLEQKEGGTGVWRYFGTGLALSSSTSEETELRMHIPPDMFESVCVAWLKKEYEKL